MTADQTAQVNPKSEAENTTGSPQPEGDSIFTMVKASELYPGVETITDGNTEIVVPFTTVPGEFVGHLAETGDGWIVALSNYRLHISEGPLLMTAGIKVDQSNQDGVFNCPSNSGVILNVPLSCIELCEQRDLFYLQISCKDGRFYRIQLETNAMCELWHKRISQAVSLPEKIQDVFAFAHYAWALESRFEELSRSRQSRSRDDQVSTWFQTEIARLRFDVQGAWRITLANKDHTLSPTYPPEVLIPASISDTSLEKVAQFRSARRFPAVVWRHVNNGAVLARCSQPEVGWLGWRSTEDEDLVRAMADACAFDRSRHHSNGSSSADSSVDHGIPSLKDLSAEAARQGDVKPVLIVDARSYTAAVGNRARGGGIEYPEYYPNTETVFMNLANIHTIRKSFQAIRLLCNSPTDQSSWFHALDGTKWLHHVSLLFKAAIRVVRGLEEEERPVMVHCSDGWDRTPQIVALAELMLDPYYRSIEGFQVLVEKEWLDFGHKMADRNGLAFGTPDLNERSPIFLQWLDCVHQLLLQFPCSFEFNLSYLVKLAQHTYSSLFGTFLCNSLRERKQHRIKEQTRKVWDFLRCHPYKFCNLLYSRRDEVLWPRSEVRDLLLWRDVYISELRPSPSSGVGQNGIESSRSGNISSEQPDSGTSNSRDDSESEAGDAPSKKISLVKEELEKLKVLENESETENISADEEEVQETVTKSSAKSIQLQKVVKENKTRAIDASTDTLVPEADIMERSKLASAVNDDKPVAENESSAVEMKTSDNHTSKDTTNLESSILKTACESCNGHKIEAGVDGNSCQQQSDQVDAAVTHHLKVNGENGGASAYDEDEEISAAMSLTESKFEDPFDSDGLPAHHNEIQRRLVSIFASHDSEVQHLRRDLYLTRMALCRTKLVSAGNDTNGTDCQNLSRIAGAGGDLTRGDGGMTSNGGLAAGHCNSASSDASSWENVDEKESKQTLWVPDHASPSCMRCHIRFWLGRRKHHCRNCGELVCADCSDNLAPIPNEQLYHPVRICDQCYQKLYPEEWAAKLSVASPDTKSAPVVEAEDEEGEASVILDGKINTDHQQS